MARHILGTKLVAYSLPLLLLLLILCSACQNLEQETAVPRVVGAVKQYLVCDHYDEKAFLKAVEQARPYELQEEMLAATSPHFMPMMRFTANILSTLTEQHGECETVFVLAPNHSGEGLPFTVADRGWSTPLGRLEQDEEATAAIMQAPLLAGKIGTDDRHLQEDHSAATLMPFIKYYLPEVRVVTVLLGKACSLDQLQELARIIYETGQTKSVFVLASLDFSHYLDIKETARRDNITAELIAAGDVSAIKLLDSGNMDSPEAMIVLLDYAAYFSGAKAELRDYVILPESDIKPDIGYSYQVYVFSRPNEGAR